MTRKLTLAGKRATDMTTPAFHECRRCDSPILVGQKVITLTTEVRTYHAHVECPEYE